jgi:hypothetical protein
MAKDKAASNISAAREQAAKQTAENVEANSGLSAPTGGALKKAQQEGVVDAVRESAKDAYQALTDGGLPGVPPARQYTGMDEVMQYAGILDLDFDAFRERIEEGGPVPEEKVAGLLSLERAGRNRTDFVRALLKRLKEDDPRNVTNAGPGHTNDVTPISKL